ncbi:MAG: uvrC [Alphaproteobacteria bacterium]|jgi:excinuclease ABC subunit C|nr:uvrC [Alphaproteobacteria bacterium]
MVDQDDEIPAEFGGENETAPEPGTLAAGIGVIKAHVKTLPRAPGVYRMIDAKGDVIYVGKARFLRNRVGSYTQTPRLTTRLMRMVSATASMEFVVTGSEAEALLLESNLIKKFRPRFNVMLKDDKSFPYILIRRDHPWPQLVKHRGARQAGGDYFGPFASAGAVNRTLYALQRAFPLRSCSDAIFANRTRPCLQYQIKRCTAPCTNYISHDEYEALVGEVRDFLSGRSRQVQETLSQRMEAASAELDFERAAVFRDRIKALTQIQSHQSINNLDIDEADVFALHAQGAQACIQVFFLRGGQNLGNRPYFSNLGADTDEGEALASLIGQFYTSRPPPKLILVSHALPETDLLESALSLDRNYRVKIIRPQRGPRADLMTLALQNAREALARRAAESSAQRKLLEGLAALFGLAEMPERIEVYDNSHIQGSDAVGAMIVAGPEGFVKNSYRKFNIRTAGVESGDGKSITPGDDYGMMREVFTRRFARALKEDPDRSKGQWPDLVVIDGGAGQLAQAQQVLADLGISELCIVSIAKGPDRNAGRERFFAPGREPFSLEPRDPLLYFLQRLRDEAHRFAIGTHRDRRSRAITNSPLDEVAGVGSARKRALLLHFGSARAVAAAKLVDLEAVPGISRTVARKVYDHFHDGG